MWEWLWNYVHIKARGILRRKILKTSDCLEQTVTWNMDVNGFASEDSEGNKARGREKLYS